MIGSIFLRIEDFHPQNVLVLFLFFMKYSYLLMVKIYPDVKYFMLNIFSLIGDIGNIEYFNTNLEEYKVIYLDETFNYTTKEDFNGEVTFKKKKLNHCYFSFLLFYWTFQPQNVLNLFYFLTSFSLVVFIRFFVSDIQSGLHSFTCSNSTMKIPDLILVSLLLTLNKFHILLRFFHC